MEKISSMQNPKIKNLLKLRKARERKKQDRIVIEGRHEIYMAQAGHIKIEELFLCEDYPSDGNFEIGQHNLTVTHLEKEVFKRLSIRQNPDGFLALARPRCHELEKIKISDQPLVLVLDKIEKPGNLGGMLRTADGAGVDAVLVSDPQIDLFNQNVIRASLGTVFTQQIVLCSAQECQAWLKKHGIAAVAASPRAEKKYTKIKFYKAMAIVIGAEHEGLDREWLDFATEQVRIPMKGKVDSLNASVSAALLLYKACEQREQN